MRDHALTLVSDEETFFLSHEGAAALLLELGPLLERFRADPTICEHLNEMVRDAREVLARARATDDANVERIRAILSWNAAPPCSDPNHVPTWGNREETLIEIGPTSQAPAGKIAILGGIPTGHIDDLSGLTDATAKFATNNTAPDGLGRPCPFAGRVTAQGAPIVGYSYVVEVSPDDVVYTPVLTDLEVTDQDGDETEGAEGALQEGDLQLEGVLLAVGQGGLPGPLLPQAGAGPEARAGLGVEGHFAEGRAVGVPLGDPGPPERHAVARREDEDPVEV